MRIPSSLKIGGHIITVRFSDGIDGLGRSDYQRGEILLDPALPQTLQESTLIHEMMHYINTTLDHELLDSLAEQLYASLKENNLLNEGTDAPL